VKISFLSSQEYRVEDIFVHILEEYRERSIEHLRIKELTVKRFQIPGMYLG
jgi:hypothetical protein